ncbi:MAG: hypothetical protein A3E07_02810 [Candidatus Wildermuthbacteria bacterium RIFCSPHIGHO2_12_FULL_45_9]|nr:MAG: hypothetical protein A3E07_02810 [Candidatus Wildermuthbacteria bacterium RIFCSPHIGHO2_12_FULL_45_9]
MPRGLCLYIGKWKQAYSPAQKQREEHISAGTENLGGNMTTRQNSEKFDDEQRARVRAILERMGGNGTPARPLWENQDDWPPFFHAHCREERNEDPK